MRHVRAIGSDQVIVHTQQFAAGFWTCRQPGFTAALDPIGAGDTEAEALADFDQEYLKHWEIER